MANDISNNPIRIDTFTADVTIGTGPIWINAIIVTAYTSAKTVTFIDDSGEKCLVFEIAADSTGQFTPSKPACFSNGLIFDQSASELAASDFMFIWVH